MRLTAIVICRSRHDKGFERAVKSVGFADEVLVVERREISDWAAARNEVMERAKGEWVMFVDSDEEVGEGLKREILEITDKGYKDYKNYNISGVYFKRRDRFLGKWLRHGETANVRLLRLARREAGKWERPVHEVWEVKGKVLGLKNPILHYSHQSVSEMVEKLDRYSGMEAEYQRGRMAKWLIMVQMAANPPAKFIQNYFIRLGFLDGMEGLIHALLMSGYSFLVRAKLINKLMR